MIEYFYHTSKYEYICVTLINMNWYEEKLGGKWRL